MPHKSDPGNDSGHSPAPAPSTGKVIDLQGYLTAERTLDSFLASGPADATYPRKLSDVAGTSASVLAVITRRLDGFRPEHIEALARAVAAYPDRPEAIAHLERAVADRRLTDARRMGIAMLLEYGLGVPTGDDFVATLHEPTAALALAFRGAVQWAPSSLLLQNYVQGMLTQPSELLFALYTRLVELEGDSPVEVARLLALHPDEELSIEVVEALAQQGSRASVQALALLEPSLSYEASHAAGRALQKFRLAGYNPRLLRNPEPACRALLTPIDGGGNRVVLLIVPGKGAGSPPVTLEAYTNDVLGLIEAVATPAPGNAELPRQTEVGYLHRHSARNWSVPSRDRAELTTPAQVPVSMLEAPYLYGLDVLREALRRNWLTVTPLPLDYGLYSHLFWVYSEGLETARELVEQEGSARSQEVVAREADLLLNPAFDSWYLAGEPAQEVAEEISTLSGGPPVQLTDDSWRHLLPALIRLAHDEFGVEVRNRYAHRLGRMSEWLRLSGQLDDAASAASAAVTMLKSPPETNLLVLRLVQRGILVALGKLSGQRREHRRARG